MHQLKVTKFGHRLTRLWRTTMTADAICGPSGMTTRRGPTRSGTAPTTTPSNQRSLQKLDVVPQGELPAAGVPVGGGFFGDNQGAGGGNRPAQKLSALSQARQQVGQQSRFARLGRTDQGGHLAPCQVAIPEPGQAGLAGAGQLSWAKRLKRQGFA